MFRICFIFIILSFVPYPSAAQQPARMDMDEAVAIALAHHPVARNAVLEEQKDMLMQRQSVELAPIRVKYWQRSAAAGNDRLWSVTQDFGVIPEHFRRAQHYRTVTAARRTERALTLDELVWQVKAAYFDVVFYRRRLQLMQEHDHYFEALISTAEIHMAADSITELARVSAGTRYAAYQSRMYIAEEELKRAETRLRQLLYLPDGQIETGMTELELYRIHPEKAINERFDPVKHQAMDEAQLREAESAVALEKSRLYPAVHAGYIYQHIEGMNDYQGWMAGLSVPLWAQPQRARIRQAETDVKIKANETEYRRFSDRQHVETLQSLLNEYFVQVSFSKENLLVEAQLALEEVEKDFSTGRVTNYAEAFTKVSNAVSAKINHLEYINMYNRTALELEYYTQ
ncbi:MAG: TolC family protein [Bacteroidales bacterium]|jgi:cobalt-zinc-cadmium resistance protein CzcA|nr:TolC family protein [Bacteroidales bacterium]